MDTKKEFVLRKSIKWKMLAIVLLGLVNIELHSAQRVNERMSTLHGQSRGTGMPKRNVVYNYVSDRPRPHLARFRQATASPRNNIATLQAKKQRLALLMRYRHYLGKLYSSKRRSDINSPILTGDITDYKDKEYESTPGLITGSQNIDINKKYASKMLPLNYYTSPKSVLPEEQVQLPQQAYHSPVESNLASMASYSAVNPQAGSEEALRQFSSKEEPELERLIEMEKLRELEELREQAYRHLRLHPCQTHTCQHGHCIPIGRGHYKCSCKPGYNGPRCQYAQHRACTPNPCMNDGVCTQVETGYECSCAAGYRGKTCEEQLQCENQPCENGGTCTELDIGFDCTCAKGYRGKTCEIENPCLVNPCQNGGQCVEEAGGYQCTCRAGWRCNDCSCKVVEVEAKVKMLPRKPPVDRCRPNPCTNGGTCSPTPSGYVCYCDDGYKGDTCEAQEFCAEAPCMNGGLCVEGDGTFLCHCTPGFKGKSCEATDFCNPNPCLHNGVCVVQETGGYKCRCLPQYTGLNCEGKNPCIPNPCANMGACKGYGPKYSCACANGFTGLRCQEQDQCFIHNPCKNKGTCGFTKGLVSCHCPKGFNGPHCELKDFCEPNPCANDGVCTSDGVTFHCRCLLGFTGESCNENDNCQPDPCQNNGQCSSSPTGYRCHCTNGFIGANCENEDPCKAKPCANGAVCTVIRNTAHCKCPKGYVGKLCEHSDPCLPSPCHHNGDCQTHDDGSYHCECVAGYVGSLCHLHSHCSHKPCLNGGLCEEYKNSYICRCPLEWGGHNCQEHNLCYPNNPCENNGICKSDGHNIVCKCQPGFLGDHCEEVNYCHKHVCKNGGKCYNTKSGYECDCPEGFGGKNCDGFSSPCMPNPCLNDGFCTEDKANEKGYLCICKQGFAGKRCLGKDACIPNPCKNEGKCFAADNRQGYHCICIEGKRGLHCEHNDYCYPQNPCLNGATCFSTHVGYVCKCRLGFKGQKCEAQDTTNPCALHPCLNGGTCYDQRNSQSNLVRLNPEDIYKCFCIRGYSGKNCEVPQYACYSEPCQNGATCMDAHKFSDIAFDSTGYKCLCSHGFSGRNCQMSIRSVEGGTSDFVSSLTSGYDRLGFVPVPKPDLTSAYSKPSTLEENNPTEAPNFPTVRRSYDTNPEQSNIGLQSNVPNTAGYFPPNPEIPQPTVEEIQANTINIPLSALPTGSRRGQITRLPKGVHLIPIQRYG